MVSMVSSFQSWHMNAGGRSIEDEPSTSTVLCIGSTVFATRA
jgi:hypothetical protein